MDETLAAVMVRIERCLPLAMLRDRLECTELLGRLWPARHPEKVLPRLTQLAERLEKSADRRELRAASTPQPTFPENLPITARAQEIIELIRQHPVIVLAGETGSGKTTQIPKMCLAAGLGVAGTIACTQPRRVAALSVSQRIAEELNVPYGREVGAKIRFTDRTSEATRIKMLTDGMLLSEIQGDPLLRDYEAIIVDEAHERSLNIDFLLGYLKTLREHRPDLKIIVTSATIDTATFSRHFGDAPIIEVSGRVFPVEVQYAPVDEVLEESGETSYLEAAAAVIGQICEDNRPGDILTFLPAEKDIRELRQLLEGRNIHGDILPLFGRLSNDEQQRIFHTSRRRKVILATNIAETSLTIPGIRYVVDSGLARISRYSAHTRTQRLPIEPVAQSSAEQRKGRAGRVSDGVCIRLYSEKDYLSRPQYSTPEIQRANLAAVILRMLAFGLGQIDTFPFIDPPQERAIRAGYQLLQDLGALDREQQLTPLGRQLARLPCDPTVGRMLLAAEKESCVREVLVIASGLSIQDPRERPLEAREAADQQHKKFVDPKSDFLTYLKLWNAYHDQVEKLTQKQLRKFCTEHFLSYLRMREWADIHSQLSQVLKDVADSFHQSAHPAEYHQIHRALLTGLLGNIAHRDENNFYKAPHNRAVMVFPGSALFDKKAAKEDRKKGVPKAKEGGGKPRTPEWIMCAEWVETSRLYGRTCAEIDPRWILELGAHLCSRQYTEPYYEASSERVLCKERVRLYGLEIAVNRIAYQQVNPTEATEIFIRNALVAGELKTQLSFFNANQELRAKVETLQTRRRHASAWTLDERVYQFYAARIQGVGSVHDLRRLAKDRAVRGTTDIWDFLYLSEEDLLDDEAPDDRHLYPDAVDVNGAKLELNYQYQPGAETDGATLKVPISELDALDPARLDWMIPGYLEDKVNHLLRALPKETRVKLHPIGDKAKELTQDLQPQPETLIASLTKRIIERYGVRIWPDEWNLEALPAHLRPRVEVVDHEGRTVAAGRDLDAVTRAYQEQARADAEAGGSQRRKTLWQKAVRRYEQAQVTETTYPELPLELSLAGPAELPVLAYPGLKQEGEKIAVRLFDTPEAAAESTAPAFRAFALGLLSKDLAWVDRDLERELRRLAKLPPPPVPPKQAPAGDFGARLLAAARQLDTRDRSLPTSLEVVLPPAKAHLQAHVLAGAAPLPLSRAGLLQTLVRAKERAKGWPPVYVDQLLEIHRWQRAIIVEGDLPAWANAELDRLVPPDFMQRTPVERIGHLPRYLAAVHRRLQRARLDPIKDAEKVKRVAPYAHQLGLLKRPSPARERLRWLLEEFRVQVFAQEMGTAEKVSQPILDEILKAAFESENPAPGPVSAPEDAVAAQVRREAKQQRPASFQSVEELRRALGAR